MGLIRAAVGAISGTMADQWKEYFQCDAIDADVLIVKGQKHVSGKFSNNKSGDNVISDGSAVVVADGQCLLIVDQGKIMDVCAEPGVYTYKTGTTPSVFAGNLKDGLKGAALDAWNRFQFGGGAGKDQRVYYVNTKEIIGNKYGTANPIPFKVMIDPSIGRSISIGVRCNGEYSYKIVNPMLFYTEIGGNVTTAYERATIDSQLKSEVLSALNKAFGMLSAKGVDYSEIPLHTDMIVDALNEALTPKWSAGRGISVASFAVNSVSVSEEDKIKIQNLEQALMMSNPMVAAGNLAQAQADALRTAAGNQGGAMAGFMGMGMAGMAGGLNANDLFAQGMQMQQAQRPQAAPQQAAVGWTCACGAVATGKFCPECGAKKPEPKVGWTCACGATATGKFCPECGSPKPADNGWTCACGAVNKGKFCSECGSRKPAGAPLYQCDKCGWQPEDPKNPPRFCPECGDVFDENDVK